jgi:hypothetical protein
MSSISRLVVEVDSKGQDRRTWGGGVTAGAKRGFRRFIGRGSSSSVSYVL